MLRKLAVLSLSLILLLPAAADAVGVSGHVDPVYDQLVARRDALEGIKESKKVYKQLAKGVRFLEKTKASESFAGEAKFAAKVVKVVERKLPGEAELLARATTMLDHYTADLYGARAGMAALAAAAAKPTKLERALKKTDKFLLKAAAATSLTKRAVCLAKVAKLTAGHEPTGTGAAWVVQTLTLADAGEGVDFTGDGFPDNALGASQATLATFFPGLDIDALLADALANGETAPILQMWGIDSWDSDGSVFAGILGGMDLDGDPADNYSGTEVFDVSGSTDLDGFPLARGVTAFTGGGTFAADLGGEEFDFGGFTLGGAGRAAVEGTASEGANQGVIGFVMPVTAVYELLEGMGFTVDALVRIGVGALADVDLDGNGVNDGISGAFDFDAVPCGVTLD